MDQEVIAGIGNIYSDEVLWFSHVNPLERVRNIPESKLKSMYAHTGIILKESIAIGGDSLSDYRNPLGKKGGYQNTHKVYRQTGKHCAMRACRGIIRRVKVGGRSAHYCDVHQKLL